MKIITTISMMLFFLTACSSVESTISNNTKKLEVQQSLPVTASKSATVPFDNSNLSHKIGQMLMVGFFGINSKPGTQICNDIKEYNLGGAILFDFNPVDRSKPKNIKDKDQLRHLTQELQECSPKHNLLIAVDQEGGKVQRLKTKYGFYGKFPKASEVSKEDELSAQTIYDKMGKELHNAGINFNLAPVVDLAINPKNVVINKLGRSYGANPNDVVKYASVFMNEMNKNKVLTSLKHFPGHGSSVGDTHKGFVDVTNDWEETELEPYKVLIDRSNIDTVMVAHVFNANLDPNYPASLSLETITKKLRNEMGYNGVVITDDLQMNAIDKKYGLRETLRLAINAGNDILLFGNQLNPRDTLSTKKLVEIITDLVEKNEIDVEKIDQAYARIQRLKNRYFLK